MGDLVERSIAPCKKALEDAGKKASDIEEVVLVGGSTRIPMVQKKVKEFFGREPHRGVNPDEVVALGAAVQAGVLSGEVKDILLLDVTPLSLGIETLGGVNTVLIPRNTTIPTRKTETFSTASDNQTSVEVHVLQGERPMARDNRTLGKFHLDGIPSAPRGVPQIEVTFDIDANGIVNVNAKDKATNKEQHITITASSGLSESDIKKMVDDAQKHEDEDKKRREAIEAKNKLDSLTYSTQKLIDENRDKIPEAERVAVEEELKKAKDVLEANKDAAEATALNEAIDGLQRAAHKLAEAMYRSAGPGAGGGDGAAPGAGAAGGTSDSSRAQKDVIDAEFEETK
jgi:molecular chaperone DnaK